MPPEVRAAANLLMTWTLDEALKMRLARMEGPCVMLYELVGAVCQYFLEAFQARTS